MPFINDKLEAQQESAMREQLAQTAARASRFTFNPEAVLKELKQAIVGQDHVVAAMSDLVHVLKADIAEPSRPLSVNFFVGPTGVGKTETVKVLAKALAGSVDNLCRVDMNTLAQEHYSAAITGAPPGYVGSKEGHTLLNRELIEGQFTHPGIVLFDEIEKASEEVIRSLLNILDTGVLHLPGCNKTINFSNTLIFMTSNLGARELMRWRRQRWCFWRRWQLFHKTPAAIIDGAIRRRFDPEFINRIERLMVFNYLPTTQVNALIDRELIKLNQRLAKKNASLNLSESARRFFASFYNDDYGARNLSQQFRTLLLPVVARALIEHPSHNHFTIGFERGRLQVDL